MAQMATDQTATVEGTSDNGQQDGQGHQDQSSWTESLPDDLRADETITSFGSIEDLARHAVKSKDYKNLLPEELRHHPSISDVKDLPGVVNKLIHAEKKIGEKGIIKPDKDASPEEWDKFWAEVGRPANPGEYSIPSDGLPEGVEIDENLVKSFFDIAHKNGMTKEQVENAIKWQAEMVAQSQQKYEQQQEQHKSEVESRLKSEWGSAFPERMKLAKNAVAWATDNNEDLANEILATLGNSEAAIKAFAKIGMEISDDDIVAAGQKKSFVQSPAEAQAEISQLYKDEKFMEAYKNQSDPGHRDAMDRMKKLHEAAYPG